MSNNQIQAEEMKTTTKEKNLEKKKKSCKIYTATICSWCSRILPSRHLHMIVTYWTTKKCASISQRVHSTSATIEKKIEIVKRNKLDENKKKILITFILPERASNLCPLSAQHLHYNQFTLPLTLRYPSSWMYVVLFFSFFSMCFFFFYFCAPLSLNSDFLFSVFQLVFCWCYFRSVDLYQMSWASELEEVNDFKSLFFASLKQTKEKLFVRLLAFYFLQKEIFFSYHFKI